MKYSIAVKFLAIILCACSLLAAVGFSVGVMQLIDIGLYESTLDTLRNERMQTALDDLAENIAGRYAAAALSNCPRELIDQYFSSRHTLQLSDPTLWFYTLEDAQGIVLDTNYALHDTSDVSYYEFIIAPEYPVILDYQSPSDTYPADPTTGTTGSSGETEPDSALTQDENFLYSAGYGWTDDEGLHYYTLGFYRGPAYLVTIHLLPGAYTVESSYEWEFLQRAYENRYALFIPLVVGVAMFALLLVYLCCAAGRSKRHRDVRPGGLNVLPLDLYAALLLSGGTLLAITAGTMVGQCFTPLPNWGVIGLVVLICFGICVMIVAFLFALSAQLKARHGYLVRHSLIGMIVILLWQAARWLGRLTARCCRSVWQSILRVFALLPLIWQWVFTGSVMLLVLLIALFTRNIPFIVIAVAADVGMILYGAYAFGVLMKSAREMSHGHLSAQVDERAMTGSFRDFAGHLNALAGVAVVAGQNQARSERMKAELITNVSHDIKTPLTSIITYVDLMKTAGSPEEASAYLEVLDRQSQRLKKLIDDLIDMSKASTGNMPVEITKTNAVETVLQALGEFSDKLEAAGLTTVFNPPQEPMTILADGRLTWRVLSNLFSNAVKYALPGSRVHIEMSRTEQHVLICVKNVSREMLNISTDGLLERFVRGDTSRNTEGSGLGLNIASSLMELQHGRLQLQLDGDLFNATLVFPAA